MSVTNSTNKTLQDGNGSTVAFDFTFKIFKDSDLKVYKITKETGEMGDPLVLNTDYTVTINKVGEGGTVTFTTAPTTEQQVGIYRIIDITQPANIPTDTEYVEKTLENALDRACMISQQLHEAVGRCIAIPEFADMTEEGESVYENVNTDLPTPVAENVLAWNEDATGLVNYDVKQDIQDFEDEVNDAIDEFKSDVNTAISDARTEFATQITTFETEVGTEIANFESEINQTISEVQEAAEKINELEEAVQTAVDKADEATQQATTAQTAATNATTQANKAEAIATEMEENYEAITDFVTSFPASTPITSWITDGDGTKQNIPLKSFEAYNTPFIKNAGDEHTKLNILGPLFVLLELQDSTQKYYVQKNNIVLDVISALDTGSALTAGKDYYVYLCWDTTNEVFEWKVSLNSTYPDGYDEYTSRKLGGFHTLCVGVTSSNTPQANHPAIGYAAGDIIPNSVWAYNFKASSGNAGKVYIDVLRKWCYIYNVSGNGSTTGSVYGATRSHTRTYHHFVEDLFTVGDEMIGQDEFSVCMDMSNYKTAVAGAAQPNPDTTGGHLDTAGKRMISKYFVEEGCGLQWQFTKGLIGGGGSGWSSPDGSGAKGQQYGSAYVVIVGGAWTDGGYTGPRCRYFSTASSLSYANCGGRGLSCHVEY